MITRQSENLQFRLRNFVESIQLITTSASQSPSLSVVFVYRVSNPIRFWDESILNARYKGRRYSTWSQKNEQNWFSDLTCPAFFSHVAKKVLDPRLGSDSAPASVLHKRRHMLFSVVLTYWMTPLAFAVALAVNVISLTSASPEGLVTNSIFSCLLLV